MGEELRRKVDRADSVHGSDTDESGAGDSGDDSDESGQDSEGGNGFSKKAEKKLRKTAAQILEGDFCLLSYTSSISNLELHVVNLLPAAKIPFMVRCELEQTEAS